MNAGERGAAKVRCEDGLAHLSAERIGIPLYGLHARTYRRTKHLEIRLVAIVLVYRTARQRTSALRQRDSRQGAHTVANLPRADAPVTQQQPTAARRPEAVGR